MIWMPYPQYTPQKSEQYKDFVVLYPYTNLTAREGSRKFVADIMCWDGENFIYHNPKHKPVYWGRLPSFPEDPDHADCA